MKHKQSPDPARETRVIATICARGGSKGVPGKNLRNLQGVPLVARAVRQAVRCGLINAGVYVSTDDETIADVARDAGATVPMMRPPALATDNAGKLPVIRHLCETIASAGKSFDIVVDLDPTCPLRDDADILGAVSLLTPEVDVVIGCTEARKNPYFNMVERGDDGYARLVKQAADNPVSRQQSPRVFEISGAVYVWHARTLPLGLWDGRAAIYEMPPERSIDIDTELDFRFVEYLLEHHR